MWGHKSHKSEVGVRGENSPSVRVRREVRRAALGRVSVAEWLRAGVPVTHASTNL